MDIEERPYRSTIGGEDVGIESVKSCDKGGSMVGRRSSELRVRAHGLTWPGAGLPAMSAE
jgi:hypothetical protein